MKIYGRSLLAAMATLGVMYYGAIRWTVRKGRPAKATVTPKELPTAA